MQNFPFTFGVVFVCIHIRRGGHRKWKKLSYNPQRQSTTNTDTTTDTQQAGTNTTTDNDT
jgi:hypothetical protein